MNRLLLSALLVLTGAANLQAQLNPAELEEAAEFARRVGKSAVAGPQRNFAEALEVDSILERSLGASTWRGLAERQREQVSLSRRAQWGHAIDLSSSSGPRPSSLIVAIRRAAGEPPGLPGRRAVNGNGLLVQNRLAPTLRMRDASPPRTRERPPLWRMTP